MLTDKIIKINSLDQLIFISLASTQRQCSNHGKATKLLLPASYRHLNWGEKKKKEVQTWLCRVWAVCLGKRSWAWTSFAWVLLLIRTASPVVEFFTIWLLASSEHAHWPPCLFHHVHYTVQHLEDDNQFIGEASFQLCVRQKWSKCNSLFSCFQCNASFLHNILKVIFMSNAISGHSSFNDQRFIVKMQKKFVLRFSQQQKNYVNER